jgi:glyoxylase-like metal-dependent hydrolase (beta-lactamase superfamily II)
VSELGEELGHGLRRWSAHHEEWRKSVASVAVLGAGETGEEMALIDPLLGPDQWGAFDELADGRAVHVLLTTHWHARSAAELASTRGARVWAYSGHRAAVARRAPVDRVFGLGDELPAGLVALAARPRSELVFWEPRNGALITGDAVLGDGERGEGLHTCPRSWLPASSTVAELRSALAPALELPVKMVLPSHGAPVLRGARPALAGALG